MKKIKTELGKKLAHIRKEKGLTQIELAKMTGISNRMIAHYETKASTIPIEKLALIAKAMQISLDEISGIKEINNIKPLKEKNSRVRTKLLEVEKFPAKEKNQVLSLIRLIKKMKHKEK